MVKPYQRVELDCRIDHHPIDSKLGFLPLACSLELFCHALLSSNEFLYVD